MKKIRYALCQMPMPPDDIDKILYNSEDGRELDDRAEVFAEHCVKTLKELNIYDSLENKYTLDVGSGKGYLLSMLPEKAYKVGVDPQINARIHKLPHTNIITGYMTDLKGLYDVVMSWHVIEHVDDPFQFLKEMVEHTKDGGIVIVATPNASSIFAKQKNWRCKEPFHRYLLTKKQLKEMFIDLKLKPIKSLTWGGFSSPRSWWKNILNKIAKLFGHGDVQVLVGLKCRRV